jgi:hypothetical protein
MIFYVIDTRDVKGLHLTATISSFSTGLCRSWQYNEKVVHVHFTHNKHRTMLLIQRVAIKSGPPDFDRTARDTTPLGGSAQRQYVEGILPFPNNFRCPARIIVVPYFPCPEYYGCPFWFDPNYSAKPRYFSNCLLFWPGALRLFYYPMLLHLLHFDSKTLWYE